MIYGNNEWVYGKNNEERLTGHHETASYNTFTYGIGTRNTSIRIGNETFKQTSSGNL